MCGISGIVDFSLNSNSEVLQAMTDTLKHRGPDGSGYEFLINHNAQIGLGHRRLSIIDLTVTGHQPMQSNHLWITFNGEIYNFKEIKKELGALGYSFASNSDTEVILKSFEQWGITCVNRFIGMFAFVIYDSKNDEVFCVRDRAGVKPFYYYWHDNLFLFSSELKAFHKHPSFKKELNYDAVAAFVQYGNVPTPHCIFNNCKKLKPGHFLKIDLRNRTLEQSQYWSVYNSYNLPKLDVSFYEAKTQTEAILQSAFDYRMVSDVPVGVFLSGGYDSTCVAALLQKNRSEKLKTFTISVPDIGLNEAPYAKEIAKYLGTEHNEYECSQKEALDLITELPYYYDEPFADSSAIPTTLVCLMAKKQVTVALSADAGDEVFAGYNRYDYIMRYGNKLNSLPSFIRKGAAVAMNLVSANSIPVLKHKYNFANRYEKLKSVLKDPSPQNLMLSLSAQFDDEQLNALMKSDFSNLQTAYLSKELKNENYTPLSYMMAIDYQTYLVDDILQKVDRASMTASLEGREPFLDHRIIEWAAQLPDDYKYKDGIKKYILKEIVHQYVPKTLMDRPKTGFAIPIEHWLSNELKEQVLFYLNDQKIVEQGVFKLEYVKQLKNDFFNGKKEYAFKIWTLLMFQMWYEKWM